MHFANLLSAVDAAVRVEASMQEAGFIVGFETCRQLLLGELDLDALASDDDDEAGDAS